MDIPLLFEQDYASWFDETWLVYVSPNVQLERLMKRDNLSNEAAEARLASQWPLEEKKKMASHNIKQQWKSRSALESSSKYT